MLCLIVEIVQYLKPLPPLLYKSTFSLYTILFLLTSQKSIFLHYYFILLYLYYTLYPTFFVHIFFFCCCTFIFNCNTIAFFCFCFTYFLYNFFPLSFMNKRTVFSLLFLFLFDIFSVLYWKL